MHIIVRATSKRASISVVSMHHACFLFPVLLHVLITTITVYNNYLSHPAFHALFEIFAHMSYLPFL